MWLFGSCRSPLPCLWMDHRHFAIRHSPTLPTKRFSILPPSKPNNNRHLPYRIKLRTTSLIQDTVQHTSSTICLRLICHSTAPIRNTHIRRNRPNSTSNGHPNYLVNNQVSSSSTSRRSEPPQGLGTIYILTPKGFVQTWTVQFRHVLIYPPGKRSSGAMPVGSEYSPNNPFWSVFAYHHRCLKLRSAGQPDGELGPFGFRTVYHRDLCHPHRPFTGSSSNRNLKCSSGFDASGRWRREPSSFPTPAVFH